jgi:hypothetical protein
MNSKVLVGIIIALLLALAWAWFGSKIITGDGSDDPIATGKSSQRTWAVFATDQPANQHIGAGDAFRIIKAGSKRKLIPLKLLRGRWNKPSDFVLDLVKSSEGLLCGEIELTSHETDPKHIIIIESDGPEGLQIDFDVFDPDPSKTLMDQCIAIIDTHRGRAHAET